MNEESLISISSKLFDPLGFLVRISVVHKFYTEKCGYVV